MATRRPPLFWGLTRSLLMVPCLVPVSAHEVTHRLSVEYYLDREDVASPQLSPDGR